jgi:hypothetical protein
MGAALDRPPRWANLERQVEQRDLAGRSAEPQHHRVVAFDGIASGRQHFGCHDGDRAAGVDDRREPCRRPWRGDSDDGT